MTSTSDDPPGGPLIDEDGETNRNPPVTGPERSSILRLGNSGDLVTVGVLGLAPRFQSLMIGESSPRTVQLGGNIAEEVSSSGSLRRFAGVEAADVQRAEDEDG